MKPIETWNKKKGWNVLKHEIENKVNDQNM